jgi:outer membrane protein assembly factor BamB
MKFLEIVPMPHGGRIMPKKISRSGWAFALLAVLVPGISAAQPAGRAAALHDGVVVDLTGGTAYVMSREGGIDAIQLSTGNVIWKSREAAKPLLVKDGVLVAQAAPAKHGELVLATIDARRGVARERVEVAIPSSLRANILQGPSQSFETRAFLDKDGSVVVAWNANDGRSLQGMLPPEPEGAPVPSVSGAALTAQARSGAVRLEIGTGRAVPMAADAAKGIERAAAAAISVRRADPSAGARELTSLDGKHVLRSERAVEGALSASYRWTIAEASGRALGTVEAPVSMAPFVVSGSRVLYVAQPSARRQGEKVIDQPLRLVALDLGTGSESWTSPLLDPVYRGPFPP